jgi:hypothetical protein
MKKYTYVVAGSGRFPFDMLRHSQAWPEYETESSLLDSEHRKHRKIRMASHTRPVVERWSSFGWTVIDGPVAT